MIPLEACCGKGAAAVQRSHCAIAVCVRCSACVIALPLPPPPSAACSQQPKQHSEDFFVSVVRSPRRRAVAIGIRCSAAL